MNETRLPTPHEIDELVAFLQKLYAEGFEPVKQWHGGEKRADGAITVPYPEYDAVVTDFYHTVAAECWLDYGYSPEEAARMIKSEDTIKTSTLAQIKTMLTYCVRGERFCDGHWEEMIVQGHIRRLLERLIVLRAKMTDQR